MNNGDRIRLIIVDDEQEFADVLVKRMRRRGMEAAAAFNGEQALRLMRGNSFDLAIVDLKLEGMDGIEILRIFKMLDPGMPVLMLTGHGCEAAADLSMKNGAADYLSKPMDFDQLVTRALQVSRREE